MRDLSSGETDADRLVRSRKERLIQNSINDARMRILKGGRGRRKGGEGGEGGERGEREEEKEEKEEKEEEERDCEDREHEKGGGKGQNDSLVADPIGKSNSRKKKREKYTLNGFQQSISGERCNADEKEKRCREVGSFKIFNDLVFEKKMLARYHI